MSAAIDFGLSRLPKGVKVDLVTDSALESQSYRRVKKEAGVYEISASDDAGFMYALLDLAEECGFKGNVPGDKTVTPYLKKRGIKFNIPLDGRTPSYSDASDSAIANVANMWDYGFWTSYLDRLAEEKINVLSLWSLNPFPSMIEIPEFPKAHLEDVYACKSPKAAQLIAYGMYDRNRELVLVKKMTIREKIDFWRRVMAYARSRCIAVLIVTWNIFTYGTEGQDGGIPADQLNPLTQEYFRAGTRTLIETYPDLMGIGITSGENMWMDNTDIPFLSASYGMGIKDALKDTPEREFHFIHRMQMAHYQEIIDCFSDLPCPLEISFKYSQAHMLSSVKPHFIDGFLKQKKEGLKVWLTIRNDDFYLMRWGNAEFIRQYLSNMPVGELEGIYLGADGFTWGRVYSDRNGEHPLYIDKMWYFFSLFGKLAYDINLSDDFFKKEIEAHFDISGKDADAIFDAWAAASRIVPYQQCVHWHDFDFQWYPEGSCLYSKQFHEIRYANINEWVHGGPIPRDEYTAVEDYCKDRTFRNRTPQDVSDEMLALARTALDAIDGLKEVDGNAEYRGTVGDIEAMANLGAYYGYKIQAAMELFRIRYMGLSERRSEGVRLMTAAVDHWKKYSSYIDEKTYPQFLTRLCGRVDVKSFDREAEEDIRIIEREQ